ncbi:FAD-dependent oxidoreductase [Pseudomonas aeruginosa]|nr:FAD-dependent oxidoreductase [Pseudomonas aeruginosa]
MTSAAVETTPLTCDVLVVGSGAAGLAAAVTAAWHGRRVVLVEKDPVFGGASAWSGGWAWLPRNPLARRAGIEEDIEQPRTYLRHELGERYDAARIDAFLEACPHMVAFFERHTHLRFVDGNGIPDMHGDTPGAAGRPPVGRRAHMTHDNWARCCRAAARPCGRPRSWACRSWPAPTSPPSST